MAAPFMRKAYSEWVSGSARCVILLISLHAFSNIFHEIAGDADMILLKKRLRFWSDQQTPLPERAPFSSMVMILGGDGGVIQRARATWSGVFLPRRNLNPESIERI
jgi:hypothetical protein